LLPKTPYAEGILLQSLDTPSGKGSATTANTPDNWIEGIMSCMPSSSDEAPLGHRHQRWIDRDPALAEALRSLQAAESKYQAQVALNVIKVILEHQIEAKAFCNIEDLVNELERSRDQARQYYRRWYDINETLSAALMLLQDCPDDIQAKVIPSLSRMVEDALSRA
jgi:hypothetical protein